MTSYEKPLIADRSQHLQRFHHVTFWVGNAKQAAAYYCSHFGFRPIAYRGLETGSREIVSHVIQNGQIVFVLESALTANHKQMADHLICHGDAVKDIAFQVDNLNAVYDQIQKQYPSIIQQPIVELKDEHGSVRFAVIKTFGDMSHTLIECNNYKGIFLPGFQQPFSKVSFCSSQLPNKTN